MPQEMPKSQANIVRAVKQKLESLRGAGVSHIPKARSREQASSGAGRKRRAESAERIGGSRGKRLPAGPRSACSPLPPRPLPACSLSAPAPCSPRGGPGRSGQAGGRLHALPGAGRQSHADGFRRRQSACQAGLYRRGPGRGRRSAGRTFRRPGGSIAYRHHHQGHETPPRGRLHHEHPPLPAAGQSHAAAAEAANCREYLDAQLAIIQPQFICCLGACAAQNLLQVDTPIGKLRGRMIDFNGMKVLCTYHPAYVLRNPPAKRQVWDDIQILMAEMGLKASRVGRVKRVPAWNTAGWWALVSLLALTPNSLQPCTKPSTTRPTSGCGFVPRTSTRFSPMRRGPCSRSWPAIWRRCGRRKKFASRSQPTISTPCSATGSANCSTRFTSASWCFPISPFR